jgi:hypothetical protein
VRLGFEMTDLAAAPEKSALNGFTGVASLQWLPHGERTLGVGLAVIASALAAGAICAVLSRPANSALPPAGHATETASAPTHAAEPLTAGFDVGKAWAAERARLFAAANLDLRGAWRAAWEPDGAASTLLANRSPDAADTNAGGDERVVPMPPAAPVARAGATKHRAVARDKPVKIEPKVASLPPQQSEPGTFNLFDKLFGNPDHAADALLAANPKTAIYDIEKHTVYLPDGEKLEAHSGYGKWMDDPDSVERKNLGVTPPNVYAVSFRQKLFHGVRALRLTPVGDGKMYGRDGMLAHSYMLGADGQSNGCVSFKNYARFLKAYKDGVFKQLIVVRSVDDVSKPSQVASAAQGGV